MRGRIYVIAIVMRETYTPLSTRLAISTPKKSPALAGKALVTAAVQPAKTAMRTRKGAMSARARLV